MVKINIKRAWPSDAEQILEIQKLAFQSEAAIHQDFSIPPLLQTIESIKEDFLTFQFYKAVADEQIVAAVKVRMQENNLLSIGRLVVHPEYQNKGIGKKLMCFVEKKYNEVQAYELFTAEKSLRNINFYKNLGYSIIDTFTEPGHSNIVLVKFFKLNSHSPNK